MEKLKGGKGDNKPDTDFDPAELAKGIKHELEHTKDRAVAKEIAKDHLSENPHYYTELAKAKIESIIEGFLYDNLKSRIR